MQSTLLHRTAIVFSLLSLLSPAQGDVVLLGTDYFETRQPTFFEPLGGALNPLAGLSIGPGTTDTLVQRQGNCVLDLSASGASCTIPVEMVALSLVSVGNPAVRVRESPTLSSTGSMTILSDGSGSGGTFDSFFDIFVELSFDGGSNWLQPQQLTLSASGTPWTTVEPASPPALFVDGAVGDPAANRHLGKQGCSLANGPCVDFYLVDTVQEQHPGVGLHTAGGARIPEPGALGLASLALISAALAHRRGRPT